MKLDVGQVLTRLHRLSAATPDMAKGALYAEGTRIMEQSTALAPVQTGQLRDSAYVAPPESYSGHTSEEIGYGSEHAVAAHEDLNGSSPKFLEKPLNEVSQIRGRLVADLQKRLKTGDGSMPAGRFPHSPRVRG